MNLRAYPDWRAQQPVGDADRIELCLVTGTRVFGAWVSNNGLWLMFVTSEDSADGLYNRNFLYKQTYYYLFDSPFSTPMHPELRRCAVWTYSTQTDWTAGEMGDTPSHRTPLSTRLALRRLTRHHEKKALDGAKATTQILDPRK